MKITITRSFSKKIQLKMYEPIDSFCSAEMDVDVDDAYFKTGKSVLADTASASLDTFCQSEVEKTLAKFKTVDKINAKDNAKMAAELEA